jgi:hypothetical protein
MPHPLLSTPAGDDIGLRFPKREQVRQTAVDVVDIEAGIRMTSADGVLLAGAT